MAVASLVLGIISLVLALCSAGLLGWLATLLGIVGVILGALGRKNEAKKGMATAGLVLSILGLAFGVILYIACIACAAALA